MLATTTGGTPPSARPRSPARSVDWPLRAVDPDRTAPVPIVIGEQPAGGGNRRWPALDGLRALAVLAVLCYHAGVGWLPGGLLGVDLFFVLSGFLITGLLLEEWNRTGRIRLGRFWAGRARRLLPALLVVLLAVAGYARLFANATTAASLRSDGLATLFYVANWRFALSHQGYFDTFAAPSPLRHTWSLAVEEQFYLLWPLILLALGYWGARRARGRRARPQPGLPVLVRRVAVAGAAGSALTALVMSVVGVDPSRIYYGTDTRSQALFVGAALAAVTAGGWRPVSVWGRTGVTVAGILAASVVLSVCLTVNGSSTGLYRGGFLLFALAGAVLLASVVLVPDSPLATVLSVAPLRYLGRVSYGVYLWHWPLFLTLTASRVHLTGPGLLLVRFAVTFAVSALSFRYLEQPIRTRTRRLPVPRLATPVAVAVVATAVFASTGAHTGQNGVSSATIDHLAAASAQTPVAPKSTAANRPVRVLLVGDSLALTFGANLPPAQTRPLGVELIDKGIKGCGIVGGLPGRSQGQGGTPSAECLPWVQNYRAYVSATDPDVAALLVGRWEVTDRHLDGHWTSVGQPDYDAYLSGQLDLAIDALSSRGAKVALLTTPAFEPQEAPNGDYYSETDANRVIAFNGLLRAAVDRHPRVATLVDFGHVLTPNDQYVYKMDGQAVRWPDGVHIAAAGSELAARAIFPELVRLGRSDQLGQSGGQSSQSPQSGAQPVAQSDDQSDDQSDKGAITRSVPPTTGSR